MPIELRAETAPIAREAASAHERAKLPRIDLGERSLLSAMSSSTSSCSSTPVAAVSATLGALVE
jgi:hypothetical protein